MITYNRVSEKVGAHCWIFYGLLACAVDTSMENYFVLDSGVYIENKQKSIQISQITVCVRKFSRTYGALMRCWCVYLALQLAIFLKLSCRAIS